LGFVYIIAKMNQLLLTLTLASSLIFTLVFSAESAALSKSWFREKYLQKTYDEYYHYTRTRHKLEDNDRDVCPEIHKSSVIYAITGQHLNRLDNRCSLYLHKINIIHYTPPEAYHAQLIRITVMDVLLCIKNMLHIVTASFGSIILIMILIPFR
jgi:hypothetical protein